MAGCSASGSTPAQLRGGEHGQAVRAGGVEGQLAGAPGAGLGEAGDEARRGCRRGRRGRPGRRRRRPRRSGSSGTPGSRRAARSAEAAERPAAATTSWPAAASAAPRTAPTRPAPTMPTRRRAGAAAAGGRPAARRVLREAGIGAPLVPVPGGYRTSGVAPTVGGHGSCWWCGRACGGVVLLQPDVSRRSTAEGECVTGSAPPQRAAACGMAHPRAASPPNGAVGPPLPWAGPTPDDDRSAAWARWMDGPPW